MSTGDPWVFEQQRNTDSVKFSSIDDHSIRLMSGGGEMLRVAQDGFYVRGVKLEQDDKEAELVYNAFKEWLTWSTLNR